MPCSRAAPNTWRLREVTERRLKQLDPVCHEWRHCVLKGRCCDITQPSFISGRCITFAATCCVLSGPLLVREIVAWQISQ